MLAIKVISFGCEACCRAEQPVRAALKVLKKRDSFTESKL